MYLYFLKMDNIKNVIFDLGGVVIDLDRNKAVEALEGLGIKDAGDLLGLYKQEGTFLKLEKGEIDAAEFYDELLAKCPPGTTTVQIRDAFEKFLIGLPVVRLSMLANLRLNGYKVFALSNTNPVMYNHWIDRAFRQEGLDITYYFDGIVTSFQDHCCKPDSKIFRNLLLKYDLNPAESLMLDDSEANCKAAEASGMKAICVKPEGPDSFIEICKKLLYHQPLFSQND